MKEQASTNIDSTRLDSIDSIRLDNLDDADNADNADELENSTDPGFDIFGLNDRVMQGIAAAGFTHPSPVQAETIPAIMTGRDVIAQAHTGSGKTAAFALPALHRMKFGNAIETVVLTPTRELATQVGTEFHRLGKFTSVRTGTVYGGQSYAIQYKMFERGIHVLVATPGRLLDHLRSGKLELSPSLVVIDEADEMLDMGFLDDVKEILAAFKTPHQTLLFSATIPDPVRRLADGFMKSPLHVRLSSNDDRIPAEVRQVYYVIEESERTHAVVRLLEDLRPGRAIVFVRMRIEVDQLVDTLASHGFSAKALHGDMEQRARNFVMNQFRQGQADILVATDVAARGLDIPEVSHVFNYHLPFDSKSYVHRIGRTGRAGRKGTAITLVTPAEFRALKRIQFLAGDNLERGRVPSLKQIRLDRRARLVEDLLETAITPEASSLAADLSAKLGAPEKAAQHLASMLLSRHAARENGPEEIGLSEERVERLLRPQKKQTRGARRDRDPWENSGGGFRDKPPRKQWKKDKSPVEGERPREPFKKAWTKEKPPRNNYKKEWAQASTPRDENKTDSDAPFYQRIKKEKPFDPATPKVKKPSRLRRNERRAAERQKTSHNPES